MFTTSVAGCAVETHKPDQNPTEEQSNLHSASHLLSKRRLIHVYLAAILNIAVRTLKKYSYRCRIWRASHAHVPIIEKCLCFHQPLPPFSLSTPIFWFAPNISTSLYQWPWPNYRWLIISMVGERGYLKANDVLSVDLDHVVFGEDSIPGGRRVLDDRRDLVLLEDESDSSRTVLLHWNRSLKGSATHHKSTDWQIRIHQLPHL